MQTPNLIGQQLGQYEITRLLGMGGMAAVYESYQVTVKRPVAIKVLLLNLAQISGYVARFMREVELAAALEHPHILPIYDYGTDRGMSYIVMRLLNGGSLEQRLRQLGRPSPRDTIQILGQVASALDYAHRRGIIHRDLKTSNILFDDDGNAYLSDFGIAKALEGSSSVLTGTGQVMGTPAYMSPEQWKGEFIDGRTDVYAFGIMTYNLLTGQYPFSAPTPHALMYKHLSEAPPPLEYIDPQLPPQINIILAKTLAKEPDQRYRTTGEVVEALKPILLGSGGKTSGFLTERLLSQQPTPMTNIRTVSPPSLPSTTQPRVSTPISQSTPRPTVTYAPPRNTHQNQSSRLGLILGGMGLLILLVVMVIALIPLLSDDSTPETVAISTPTAPPTETTETTLPTATEALPFTQTAQAQIDRAIQETQNAQSQIQQAVEETQNALHRGQTQTAQSRPTTRPSNTPRPTSTRRPTQVAVATCDAGDLPPRLTVGEIAYVLPEPPLANAVRTNPRYGASLVGHVQPNESFLVIDDAVCSGGVWWWEIRMNDGKEGWTAEGDNGYYWIAPLENEPLSRSSLAECLYAPAPQFEVGDVAVVDFNSSGSLLVTQSTLGNGGRDDTIAEVFDNTRLTILAGPICGEKLDRWRWLVRVEGQGLEGWASEGIQGDAWMCPVTNPECGN